MIYDGRNGYLKGNLDRAIGTIVAMTKGPVKEKNWHNTTINPAFSITITAGASGAVALQGTNDVVYRQNADSPGIVGGDILPKDNATWTDIQAATSTSQTGTFVVSYEFIRLVITTSGTGTVTNAWVRWN